MSFFKRIQSALSKDPIDHISDRVQDETVEGAVKVADALLVRLDEVAPEAADFVTGDPINVVTEHSIVVKGIVLFTFTHVATIQLKQKGES